MKQTATTPSKKFQLIGGATCLDFCNSVGGKRGVRTKEYLQTYNDFLSWCEQANLPVAAHLNQWRRKAARESAAALAVLKRAIKLREAIYRIFLAIIENHRPRENDLALLNSELGHSLSRLRITPADTGFSWQWRPEVSDMDLPLGPIARSAGELLTSSETLEHLRQCHGDNCGWLFIDSSRNHSRCWCDMRDCGNRAKVRRHRMRKKVSPNTLR